MSATPVHPLWRGSCRVLMLGTAVLAAGAGGMLAVGTQDVRLLRLGLVAALWAALFGAFAAAKMRREARSCADHVQHLQATYQLELEREVTARREHTLRVEHELRQQVEHSQRSEIVELRAEIAGMRANLELVSGAALVPGATSRTESARAFTLPAQDRHRDDSRVGVVAVPVGCDRADPAPRFGPGRPQLPASSWSGSNPHRPATPAPDTPGQRTVGDLLAAHGSPPIPRRRRSRANPD